MLLFFSKLIPEFIYPVGLVLCGAVCAFVLMRFRKKKAAFYCISCSILILWIFSTPVVSFGLVRSLEKKFSPPATFPNVSAIIVLGGATQPSVPPRRYAETNIFGDRIFHALRLAKAHYAPFIICTGGKIKFLDDFPGSEALTMAGMLREFGNIDSASIIIEDQARNTYENGTRIKDLFEKRGFSKEIILITTAMHMYRSVKIFRKIGFTVYPAPTDYWMGSGGKLKLFSFLPDAEDLYFSTVALHEYYGLLAYRIMGWL
jgi:uncharacterized SAM-binding protein YcdF (DUF218 family)